MVSKIAKPVVIFDGDCDFCQYWVQYWQNLAQGKLQFLPLQEAKDHFSLIPKKHLEKEIHFLKTDGTIFKGAQAVFEAFSFTFWGKTLAFLARKIPFFKKICDFLYQLVAQHRSKFFNLTKIVWGKSPLPSTYFFARWSYLKGLSVVYFVAFVSLWVQVNGLFGANGILPAPTHPWFLHLVCALGVVSAALGFLNLLNGLGLSILFAVLWLLYFLLVTFGREFLGFQWDNLLLEMGFLSIFLPSFELKDEKLKRIFQATKPSLLVVILLRWLLFRVVFFSGAVKLWSGDPNWRNLTALLYHYETQPLPTWIGWFAHQLPVFLQKLCVVGMFGVELIVPFFIFLPRNFRRVAVVLFVGLQFLIDSTGNYGFFGMQAIVLCLLLIDDALFLKIIPKRISEKFKFHQDYEKSFEKKQKQAFPQQVLEVSVAVIVFLTTVIQVDALRNWVSSFRTFNSYGVFAVMTTERNEIVLEGSVDGFEWREYQFYWKPSELKTRPAFVQPHMPRLDWQMWFASLSNFQSTPWMQSFMIRILQGSPAVLSLLKTNPFPGAPPRYLRAHLYRYHFTDFATRHKTGEWWKREWIGNYSPVLSLSHD